MKILKELEKIRYKRQLRLDQRCGIIEVDGDSRADDDWITINGTHVQVSEGGSLKGSSPAVKKIKESGKNYSQAKKEREKRKAEKGEISYRLTHKHPGEKAQPKKPDDSGEKTWIQQSKKPEQEGLGSPEKPDVHFIGKDPFERELIRGGKTYEGKPEAGKPAGEMKMPDGSTAQLEWTARDKYGNEIEKKPEDPHVAYNQFNHNRDNPLAHITEKGVRDVLRMYPEEAPGRILIEVNGPGHTQEYIDRQAASDPGFKEEAKQYGDVRQNVAGFREKFMDKLGVDDGNGGKTIPDGTYDAVTGEDVKHDTGFSVTFHQNKTVDDTMGGYTDQQYAEMCAIAKRTLGSDGVYIGNYGNPEVSFHCEDQAAAMRFAIEHNQESIYNCKTGKLVFNPYYNRKTNPIKQ